jgi:hypothetical protein
MATFDEIGRTGLEAWSGIIREDFLAELRGKEGYKRYNEMRLNSPIVGSMLLAIEQAIRGVKWQFSGQSDTDERVVFLQEALDAMTTSWNDHITEALTFLPFGFAPFEIVYQRDEQGRIVWRKFAIRSQDTLYKWEFDDAGGLGGMWQVTMPTYRPTLIPIEKMVIYRARAEKNNPEGRSILRTAWIPYYYWKNISQIEAIGIERDLAGLPKITLPENATTDEDDLTSDASKANKLVRNIRNDEQAGVVLPNGWEFELVSTGGTRQFDTDAVVKRYESRMLMSALAQFLMLGQDKVGSLALSSDQTDFFTMAVNATADIIAETISKYAIPRLLALNGMDPAGVKLEHTPAGDVDLTALADFLQKIGAMITWTPQDEAWLRGTAKLPTLTPDEIQAERDKKREEQMAIFGARQAAQPPQDGKSQSDKRSQDGKQSDQKLGAELLEADAPPDDDQRRVWEGRLERLVKTFFKDQQQRVLKGVKGIQR